MMQTPILLTPGPITTTKSVKQTMLCDWGSWDSDFNEVTSEICQILLSVAHAEQTHGCVPLQGSGTFAVEATLATLLGPEDKLLILMNGAYGQRMAKIMEYLKRPYVTLDMGDYLPPEPEAVAQILKEDASITHVAVVHCETSSGILNPIESIADVVVQAGCEFIIDSMSAFGALPLDARTLPFAAMVSSANKCFEGVPGFGFALIRQDLLDGQSHSHSLSLDLIDQYRYMQRTGQWRFTPPTHTVAAFRQALREYDAAGGQAARLEKYKANCDILVDGMRALGFQTLLDDAWLSPIIVTFFSPSDAHFQFKTFYQLLKKEGFIIYPGKLTEAESFRIGCIGAQSADSYLTLLDTISRVLSSMDVQL